MSDTFEVTATEPGTDNGAATGWQDTGTAIACKRHSYKGGTTCLKCGFAKPVHTPRATSFASSDSGEERLPSPTIRHVRLALGLGWMAFGSGIAAIPDRVPQLEPLRASGKVMQFEGAVAGTRLQKALRKTPAWKPIMAMMRHVGPWTDLIPLLAPPVMVGLMAWKPVLRQRLAPMCIGMLVPIMAETERMAKEQGDLIEAMGQYNEETIGQAMALLEEIIGPTPNKDASHSNGRS